jgi:hypothetical protein
MLQPPAIHHFLFHDRYYILSPKRWLYYFVLISKSVKYCFH